MSSFPYTRLVHHTHTQSNRFVFGLVVVVVLLRPFPGRGGEAHGNNQWGGAHSIAINLIRSRGNTETRAGSVCVAKVKATRQRRTHKVNVFNITQEELSFACGDEETNV